MKITPSSLAMLVTLLASGCTEAHHAAPPSDGAAPDAASPDAVVSDAAAAPDAPSPDPGSDDPFFTPCPPDFVDEGDACVAWRGIPAPPCEPLALARMDDGSVAVRCDVGVLYALTVISTWEHVDGASVPIVVEDDGLWSDGLGPHIAATFSDGSRVGTHGDVYAHPAAWRTDVYGEWRETVPPPSAFVTHGAAISDREAVFVGRDAFVVTVIRRAHLGW